MNKKVLDYILDFEDKKLRRKNGIILIDNDKVKEPSQLEDVPGTSIIYRSAIDGTQVFAKSFGVDSPLAMGVSRMFNKCEIATPITTPITSYSGEIVLTVSQDLHEIGKKVNANTMTLEEYKRQRPKTTKTLFTLDEENKWGLLTNPRKKEIAKELMTKDCLDTINSTALLQECVTYTDGHRLNYIAFINPDTGIVECIAPIDLEFNEILYQTMFKCSDSKTAFKEFLQQPYFSATTFGGFDDEQTYSERLKTIQNLLNKGKLSKNNIAVLKTALEYNLGEELEKLGKKAKAIKKHYNPSIEQAKYLWEYNRKHLGRDLGM